MFNLGAFACIFDENKKVLLCHRNDHDIWNLPGGRVELGESPWEAVIREVREEVGLEVEVVRLAGVYSKSEKNEVVFSFVCKIVGGEIACSDEANRIEWFSPDAFPENTVPKQVERIKDCLDNSASVVCKIQSGTSTIDLIKQGKLSN